MIHQKTVKGYMAQIIDTFFTMYGYKTNRLATPLIKTRTNWNHLQLLEPNVTGNLTADDIEKVKETLRKGITFWHNDNMFDYARTNPVDV
jgi:hypothetical protein